MKARLREHFLNPASGQEMRKPQPSGGIPDIDSMKVAQLKTLCKEHGLKVSGKKAVLQERLREVVAAASPEAPQSDAKPVDEFDGMSEEDLRDSLVARGMPSHGTRPDLIDRLRKDISFTEQALDSQPPMDREGYLSISKALEAAAERDGGAISDFLRELELKKQEVPKFVEVTIKSIGLTPTKETTGGAPSVTADVIRKLAGDPFADPPRYGTVRLNSLFCHVVCFGAQTGLPFSL